MGLEADVVQVFNGQFAVIQHGASRFQFNINNVHEEDGLIAGLLAGSALAVDKENADIGEDD